jgi:hypothetical protein
VRATPRFKRSGGGIAPLLKQVGVKLSAAGEDDRSRPFALPS